MMKPSLFLFSFAALAVYQISAGGVLHAEDQKVVESKPDSFDYHTVKTSEGLNFRVPADMPIELRGGLQVPIPFDEYVYGKFKKLESRFQAIEARLDALEKRLEPLEKKENFRL